MNFRIFRNWFCVFIVLFFLSLKTPLYASTWITVATLDNNSSVQPDQNINATIHTSTWFDNSNLNDTANWRSTQYTISNQNPVCINTADFYSSDFHKDSFSFSAPSDEGIYSITFQAFSNEDCTGGAITKSLTLLNAIIVTDTTSPIITVKPESIGDTTINIFSNLSLKLFDAQQINKVTINGVEKTITKAKEISIDNLVPNNFGAIEGQNTLLVYDASNNSTTFNFTLDITPPVITINSYETNSTDQDITVNATTSEGSLNISFHIFTQNGSFEFISTDLAGNITRKTVTITNINKSNSSNNISTNTNDVSSQTNFTSQSTNHFKLPVQTYNPQTLGINTDEKFPDEKSNIENNILKISESNTVHDGCWLPILFIIVLVINFFFVRYATKFTNLIPFIISTLSFSVDYLMLKKYGCDITWLSNFFWVGEIFSWLIPEFLKRKFFQK